MEQFLAFGVVGLTTAAVYAVIGSGLVLTYTTTGVFNFAHGATGMLAAFSYWQLAEGWGLPVPVALALVLLVLAPGFGLLLERFVLRHAQGLGDAQRLVITVALLSGFIATARWVWDPNEPRPLSPFFVDREPFRLGPAVITWHQAITMAVAVAVAAGLWALLNRTRTGAEMRATVDDRALVGLTGADPVRANRVAWMLGTQLAAVGGILIAPTVALDASQLSLLIVSAYAAAIFGRLRSLPLTFLGAVVVGCTESFLTGYLPQNEYLPGLRLAAPALLLFAVLLLFPHRRLRGRDRKLIPVPMPSMRGTAVFAASIVALGVLLATTLGEEQAITYGSMFALGVVALSYVPLTGYAGQVSLCQLSIAGIGAVVWAQLGAHGELWALGATILISAVVGALIALPALRLSGVYLALGTTAFTIILDRWIFTLPSFELFGVRIALFRQGSAEVVGPNLFGLRLEDTAQIMVFAAVCLALAVLGVAALRRGTFGRRLIALRDSEAAYATLGGNLLLAKVLVFSLSAGLAGLGGALYGMHLRSVTAENFNLVAGLPIFLIAVIGGLGMVGNGLFTGASFVGPNVLISVAPWLHNPMGLLPALVGIGVSRHPEGVLPMMRRGWEPLGRDRTVLAALLGLFALVWALRLGDVIGGWTLFVALLVGAHLLQKAAAVRQAAQTAPDVPVEWWGVRRPWRAEDKEVLARGLAAG
ncbi:branched-chain amino acid transport system permease protein [Thermomonospora echinospora]|uniref:Branched-chain amino acid transport system permease protein n=1 Tax=Thermomonospora echinospora TaxID=1992 RepID=A0A1H6DID8_9ACTN|nr:ABC transporter permease [Thermomonospora echinospora]SEG85018.1 branched-chain amino acid transport system permease protein [Thermomonospora echinospora]